MAVKTTQQTEEHPFRTIRKVIAQAQADGSYPRLLVLSGAESYLVRWACGYIKQQLVVPAVEMLDCSRLCEDKVNYADIYTACETLPFLSPRRLVLVEAQALLAPTGNDLKLLGEDIEKLAAYLPKLPESCMLVLSCDKPNKTRALYKAAAKLGLVYDFTPLDNATLRGWMQKKLQQQGKTCDMDMLLRFAAANGYADGESGYDLYGIENDLIKLCALADGNTITRSELIQIYHPAPQTKSFDLIDSALSQKKGAAFQILADTLELTKPSEQMGKVLAFLGLVISQLEIMLEASERLAAGQTLPSIVKETGLNAYRLQKAAEAASRSSVPALRRALDRALQTEVDIKSGKAEARLAMELLIAAL